MNVERGAQKADNPQERKPVIGQQEALPSGDVRIGSTNPNEQAVPQRGTRVMRPSFRPQEQTNPPTVLRPEPDGVESDQVVAPTVSRYPPSIQYRHAPTIPVSDVTPIDTSESGMVMLDIDGQRIAFDLETIEDFPVSEEVASMRKAIVAQYGDDRIAGGITLGEAMSIAERIARGYARKYDIDPEETIGDAFLGLTLAADRYDPDRGSSFIPYLINTVRGEIQHGTRNRHDHTPVRVPKDTYEAYPGLVALRRDLTQGLGHVPDPKELADASGMDTDTIVEIFANPMLARPVPIDTPIGDSTQTLADTLGDTRLGDVAERVSHIATVRAALASLPEREREIVTLRFLGHMTQEEIATEVGLSQMQISRLLTESLAILRDKIEGQNATHPAVTDQVPFRDLPLEKRQGFVGTLLAKGVTVREIVEFTGGDVRRRGDVLAVLEAKRFHELGQPNHPDGQPKTTKERHQDRVRQIFVGRELLSTSEISTLAKGTLGTKVNVWRILQPLIASGEFTAVGTKNRTKYRPAMETDGPPVTLAEKQRAQLRSIFNGNAALSAREIAARANGELGGHDNVWKLLQPLIASGEFVVEGSNNKTRYRPATETDGPPVTYLEKQRTQLRSIFNGNAALSAREIAARANGELGTKLNVWKLLQPLIASGEFVVEGSNNKTRYRRADASVA